MSDKPKKLSFKDPEAMYEAWLNLRLDIHALTKCLIAAGVITEDQLRLQVEALSKEFEEGIRERLRSSGLESWNPAKKGRPH